MLFFENDYTYGACNEVLNQLIQTNLEPLSPYGTDIYTESAKKKIKDACGCTNAEVYLLTGGTQANQIIIDTVLAPFEGVISAESGHINQHEAGAIEYCGHKVIALPQKDGKINPSDLMKFLEDFHSDENREHMVFPGMVYISYPTEYGTLYTKDELEALSKICKQHKIPLYLDGARLGYGLAAESKITLRDIAEFCDIFYIGGTKVGALCGEAVVFTENNAPSHFTTRIKQHGALMAKGRLCGIQFDRLFTDNLYLTISEHAIKQANKLKEAFQEKGYRFFINSPTNQIFIILENDLIAKLKEKVKFSFWEKFDEKSTVVRFATSWATTDEEIDSLISIL